MARDVKSQSSIAWYKLYHHIIAVKFRMLLMLLSIFVGADLSTAMLSCYTSKYDVLYTRQMHFQLNACATSHESQGIHWHSSVILFVTINFKEFIKIALSAYAFAHNFLLVYVHDIDRGIDTPLICIKTKGNLWNNTLP